MKTPQKVIESQLLGNDTWDKNLKAGQILSALKEAGYAIVPVEPTEEIVAAAMKREDDQPPNDWGNYTQAPYEDIYKAMIAASQDQGRE